MNKENEIRVVRRRVKNLCPNHPKLALIEVEGLTDVYWCPECKKRVYDNIIYNHG